MTYQQPDAKGFYGKFGGQFVPETLMTAVIELDKAYREAKEDQMCIRDRGFTEAVKGVKNDS